MTEIDWAPVFRGLCEAGTRVSVEFEHGAAHRVIVTNAGPGGATCEALGGFENTELRLHTFGYQLVQRVTIP